MDDDTNDDTVTVQEAFERGDLDESLMSVVENYDDSTNDPSDETQDVVENMDVKDDNREEEQPDSLTIRVPLDDRHAPMVSDIQDAGVSVEQQFIEDREFMMGVEQRIHGLFLSLKYGENR